MYEQTDWPDRIYIDERHHAKYSELLSKSDDARYPFKTAKEIFMFSMVLGFLKKKEPSPVDKKKEVIMEKYLDSKVDKPLIKALYLMNEGKDDCIIDKKSAILFAQDCANNGFDELYDIVTRGHDMVISLTEYLMENHIEQ